MLEEDDAARVESMPFRLARACWILTTMETEKTCSPDAWRKFEVVLESCDCSAVSSRCKENVQDMQPK